MGKVILPNGFNLKFTRHRYLVANRVEAQFYEGDLIEKFKFVKRLSNPEGRLRNSQLLSDKPGRSFARSGSGVRHSFEQSAHEERARKFALKICRVLEADAEKNRFSDLVIVAEPHFLGLLNQHLPEKVKVLVRQSVPKEWVQGSDAELEIYLQKKLA